MPQRFSPYSFIVRFVARQPAVYGGAAERICALKPVGFELLDSLRPERFGFFEGFDAGGAEGDCGLDGGGVEHGVAEGEDAAYGAAYYCFQVGLSCGLFD